jgi:hypothetical protein
MAWLCCAWSRRYRYAGIMKVTSGRLRWLMRRELMELAAVIGIFVVFATLFAFLTPPYESPDEPGHLNYVNFVAETRHLSDQYSTDRFVVGEGHQYPLFYILESIAVRAMLADDSVDIHALRNESATSSSPVYRHATDTIFPDESDRRAFYVLRMLSVVLGALNLVLIYAIAGHFIAEHTWRLIAVFIAATLPQYQFIAGAVNNDNLANLLLSLVIFCLLRVLRGRTAGQAGWFIALGAALGCALLAKKTSLFVLPGVVAVFGYLLLVTRLGRWQLAARMLLAPALALVISGPLLVRNQRMYGDLFGNQMEHTTMPSLLAEKSLWNGYWLDPFLPGLFRSFVGLFGWLSVSLPEWVYSGYIVLLVLASVSLIAGALRQPPSVDFWFALLLIALCFAGIVTYNLTYTQYQGRFLFPVLSLICVLVALGFRTLLAAIPSTVLARICAAALITFPVAVNVLSIITLHRFYFRLEQYPWPYFPAGYPFCR